MANESFTGPEGRFVQGDAFEPQTKDQQGAPLTIKTGPNAGQPTKRWFMAVAYPKSDPAVLPYLQKFAEAARAAWPAFFTAYNPNTPPLFGCSHPRFSIKIMDGDGMDDNGKPNKDKPGFAGHWIVKYSTSIQAPEVYHAGKYDPMERVTDPRELPRGFYVRIFASTDNNANDQRPGMYVNLSKVEIRRPGEIIQTGPSAEQAFGAGGGQTTPPSNASAPPPPGGLVATGKDGQTIEGLRAAGWSDDQMVTAGYATRPAPAAATPPPPSDAGTPPPPPSTAAAPPAPPHTAWMDPHGAPQGFKMTPAAQGAKYPDMLAAGWTHELLVQHGMVAPL